MIFGDQATFCLPTMIRGRISKDDEEDIRVRGETLGLVNLDANLLYEVLKQVEGEDPTARGVPSRVLESGSSHFFFCFLFLALWLPLYRVEASTCSYAIC